VTFDGVPYRDAPLVAPYHAHPLAPGSGQALAGALVGAYYEARNGSRVVFQQTYGVNLQNASSRLGSAFHQQSASYLKVGGGRCVVPAGASELRAWIVFGAVSLQNATATHRLIVTDGSTATNGAAVDSEVSEPSPVALGYWSPDAVTGARRQHAIGCVVSLAAYTPPVTLLAHVEAKMTAAAAYYRPLHVSCWWEV